MRPVKLKRAIESIRATADNPDQIEILVRLHSDDANSVPFFHTDGNLRVFVGPPEKYKNLHKMYDMLAKEAKGRWVWILNDDMEFRGKGWDTQLAAMKDGLVQPETNRLNTSTYTHNQDGPFPCVPNQCWTKYGHTELGDGACVDQWLFGLLVRQAGWPVYFLNGIEIWHDREGDNKD